MSHLVSGVVVVTTKNNESDFFGLTVSSFTSVSLDPHLVLFCLNKLSHSLSPILESGKFAVSILAEKQKSISQKFSNSTINKFKDTDYFLGKVSGCPMIAGANCFVECSLYQKYEAGDHYIIIGQVENIEIVKEPCHPLAYYKRHYRILGDIC
ncbi:MAG: flavin reductase family protein [Rickettsiaceae bacterium]|nr:flavin reductase family protein [Rickettsiaceae bacterium]